MQSTITLTITTGKLAGKTYTFDQRTTFIIGRNDDCHLCVPDEFYKGVSRYHCSLNINPPQITIKDLGSLNGTYVNYQKIGQRDRSQGPTEVDSLDLPEYDLKHEDEIIVGDIVLQVKVEQPLSVKAATEMIEFSKLKPQLQQPQPQPQPQKPKFKSEVTKHQHHEISDVAKNLIKLAREGNEDLQLISDYKIVKMVGKSSFSEVYVVEHKPTGKLAALKLIIPTINIDKSRIQIFSYGIENLQAVTHPNIANILGYGYAENVFFILMKYYKLGNVCNLMNHLGGKIPIPMSVGIIMQVLDGLNYGHQAEIPYSKLVDGRFGKGIGLFHRYLKPENILLSHVNRKLIAKIADYGLANSFYLAGLSGQPFTKIKKEGKPSFIPRQQVVKFRDFKPDADVWAAAACLYNMLTGSIPRDFGDEPWLDILQNDPVPIRRRNDSIPVELAKVIDLALVEKPQIYFQSAAQFKQALLKAISDI